MASNTTSGGEISMVQYFHKIGNFSLIKQHFLIFWLSAAKPTLFLLLIFTYLWCSVQRYQLCFHKISPHASIVFNLREPGRPQGLVLSQGRVNLFKCSQGSNSVANPTVPGLQRIKLTNLPKLKSLSRQRETWPHLAYVEVIGCGSHKTLPLSKRSADATKEIEGKLERCNQLEWDSIDIQSKLQPFSKEQRPRWWHIANFLLDNGLL